jgi:hypothetical protein
MSSLCDDKISKLNKFFQIKFDRNSFIGFEQEEIDQTETEDLLTIRRAVYGYLKSKKLKKRNANFMEVFCRINRELKKRNTRAGLSKAAKVGFKCEGDVFKLIKSQNSLKHSIKHSAPSTNSTDSESNFTCETTVNSPEEIFLKKKLMSELEIPDFFNDKKSKTKKMNGLSQLLVQTKFPEITHQNSNLDKKNENYFSNKIKAKLNEDRDKLFPVYNFESNILEEDLKEMEIRTAMFDYIPEDQCFSLEDF